MRFFSVEKIYSDYENQTKNAMMDPIIDINKISNIKSKFETSLKIVIFKRHWIKNLFILTFGFVSLNVMKIHTGSLWLMTLLYFLFGLVKIMEWRRELARITHDLRS